MNENDLLRAILSLCQQWVTNTSGSPPVNTVAPVLTSNADINNVYPGDILSCSTGTWTNSPTGYTYAFKWNGGAVQQTGASNTYTVLQSDIGHTFHCTVTASNGSGSGTADSNTSGNVFSLNTNPPSIDNPLPQVGETMYVSTGTWVGTPTFTYQWRASGIDIGGATSSSFLLTGAEEGDGVDCVVTANGAESVVSNTSDTVAAAATGPCVLKLYADNITGVVTDPVATWPDKSGNANDATGTGSTRPTLAAGPNGKLAALFDGVDDILDTANIDLPAGTVFAVCNRTGKDSSFCAVASFGSVVNGFDLLSQQSGVAKWGCYDSAARTASSNIQSTFVCAMATRSSAAGGWTFELNGVSDGTDTSAASPLFSSSHIGNDIYANALQGNIAAVLVFNVALTAPQIASVTAFLKDYYGL